MQTDGWDLEDIVPFSTLSLTSCAQAAIGGSTELPAVGRVWIVPDLRRIENTRIAHNLPFRPPLEIECRIPKQLCLIDSISKTKANISLGILIHSIFYSMIIQE